MLTVAKDERINLRARPDEKDLIERAATYSGVSISQYILTNVLKNAKEAIRLEQHMTLDEQDRTAFVNAFLNPTEPTPSMRKAMKAYKEA